MKKLLTATLAVAMGATIVGVAAGCNTNNNNDAETAEAAIDIIRDLYYDDAEETNKDYSVIGRVQANGTIYDVNWTIIPDASCTVEIGNYVSLSELDTENDKYTVQISNASVKIEYTLKASVTVGEVTKSVEFKHYVPEGREIEGETTKALLTISADTRTSPSSSQAVYTNGDLIVTNDQHNSSNAPNPSYPTRFYKNSKVTIEYPGMLQFKIVTDKAYVSDTKTDDYPNWLKTAIEAAAGEGVTVTLDEENLIVTVDFETPVDSFSFVATAGQVRINEVSVTGRAGGTTDQQKLDAAKAALDLSTKTYVKTGSYDLPSEQGVAAVKWTVTSDYAEITTDGKLNIKSMPTSETPITLNAELSYNGLTANKAITVSLLPLSGVTHSGLTLEDAFTATEVKAFINQTVAAGQTTDGEYYVKGYIIETGVTYTSTSQYKNFGDVYIADSASSNKDSADAFYIFRPVASSLVASEVGFTKGDLVTFKGKLQNYEKDSKLTPELVSGTAEAVTSVHEGKTDAEKAAAALADVTIPETVSGNITLKSSVNGVTLSITECNNTDIIAADGTVTRPATDTQVKFKVKATCGTESATSDEFTVMVTAPKASFEAGTYKVSVNQTNLGKTLYFTGSMNGYYGATSENVLEAADIEVAVVTGGYTLKIASGSNSGKYMEIKKSGTYTNFVLEATSSKAWTYNSDLDAFSFDVDGTAYYLGTSGTYNTISPSTSAVFPLNFVKWNYDALSAAEKLNLKKDTLKLDKTTFDTVNDELTLPVIDDNNITVSWASSNTEYVTVDTENGKITIVKLPAVGAENLPVTLTATLTYGENEATTTKTFTLTVNAEVDNSQGGTANINFAGMYDATTNVAGVDFKDKAATITFATNGGSTAPSYYTSGSAIRAYGSNTITIKVDAGFKITGIKFTYGSGDGTKAITADKGTFATDTWTGSEDTVVFTLASGSGNRRIAGIEVTYEKV